MSALLEPELFPGLPEAKQPTLGLFLTRANYVASCEQRWGRWALQDALANWEDFEELHETFRTWCQHYKRDPVLRIGDKVHNPEGTLTSMIWVMQVALEPDRSRLRPCLDFEEYFQTVFIRRGLVVYLTLLLKEME